MITSTSLFDLLKKQAPELSPTRRTELFNAILALTEKMGIHEVMASALTDAALDAGVAAWFGVTKVEAEKNFIRSRMRAAMQAVLEHEAPQCTSPFSLARISLLSAAFTEGWNGHMHKTIASDAFAAFCQANGIELPAAVPAEEASPHHCYSIDGENYTFDELHDALEAINANEGLAEGRVIHQGDAVRKPASHFFSVDRLIEDMGERAYDDAGEYADTFPDLAKEKAAELKTMVETWLDANVDVSFYTVRNTREITVTAEMIAEVAS